MSRKHFRIIAESLARTKPLPDNVAAFQQWTVDVVNLCGNLKTLNPRFDSDVFLRACGYSALERFSVL